jgi:hypothetical protein
MRLEQRGEHQRAQVLRHVHEVFTEVEALIEAGDESIFVETVAPTEGELFRTVVRSAGVGERVIPLRDSENE